MKKYWLIIGCFVTIQATFAQTKYWITQKNTDRNVAVKSCISKYKNQNSETMPLIEYVATAVMNTDMEKCILVTKNVPKHKTFVNDIKESKLVKSIIDAKSIVYYSFNAPWPFADYDCVTQMTFTEDKSKNIAIFSLVAAPLLYPKTKLDRLTEYEISYSFKD